MPSLEASMWRGWEQLVMFGSSTGSKTGPDEAIIYLDYLCTLEPEEQSMVNDGQVNDDESMVSDG